MTDLDLRARRTFLLDNTGLVIATACTWEATARKLGNVHRYVDFADTAYLDFVLSGAVLAATYAYPHPSVGRQIAMAAFNTKAYVGSNTNLGIILLLDPLTRVAGFTPLSSPPAGTVFDLKAGVGGVLSALTIGDASGVYDAIRLADPGGLGDAPEQDVRAEPTVTLLEAMRLAADRDMVARQYANGFADVFDFGTPAFLDALARFGTVEAAVIDSQLRWLAEYPDSLIARKNGPAVAEDVRQRAAEVVRLGGIATAEGRRAGVALDRHLRSDGNRLNPGTTADLITACLFVALRENKVRPSTPFRWPADDWL